jgi:hypothetical protein
MRNGAGDSAFFGGHRLKRRDLLCEFFTLALRAIELFLFVVGDRDDHAEFFFALFAIEIIGRHHSPPSFEKINNGLLLQFE